MDETPDLQAQVEAARKAGFARGLSMGLFWVAAACAGYTAVRTLMEPPRFRGIYEQVKVQMPALTVLVLNGYGIVGPALLAGLAGCAFATYRFEHSRRTAAANGVLLVAALGWMTLMSAALYMPFLGALQAIGSGR
jgi:hypothetical protein